MNKIFLMGAALTIALGFTSCKSSESAYKKAYEKAQAAQNQTASEYTNQGIQQVQQTTPVEVTPVTNTRNVNTPDYSNVSVRTENVTVVSGNTLKSYSVVVGSFSVQANAEGLRNKLTNKGMASSVVKARVNGNDWYRVIAGTFNTKNEAAAFRAAQQANYPDAWLLYSK